MSHFKKLLLGGTAAILTTSGAVCWVYNPKAHTLQKEYDSSIKEFVAEMSKHGRYAPLKEGFAWLTPDKELLSVLKEEFPEIQETFGIDSSNSYVSSGKPFEVNVTTKGVPITQGNDLKPASSVIAGGIPALWAAYIQSVLYAQGALSDTALPPVYILPSNIKNSAAFGSSIQFHVSHASPMYCDSEFSVLKILYATIKRNLLGENPERDNYMIGEIHPSAFLDWTVMKVGLGFMYHEWKYKIQKFFKIKTILHDTIPTAILSGRVMDLTEEDLKKKILMRRNTIRVAYDENETIEMRELREDLKEYNIDCREVSKEEMKQAGAIPVIGRGGSAWTVEGDGNVNPLIFDYLIEAIKNNGGIVIEGTVNRVHYSEKEKKIMGVSLQDSKGKEQFIPTNRLFTSFGAKTIYKAEDPISDFKGVESIIPGTGYSGYLLIDGEINTPIDSNNTHFTPLKTMTLKDGKQITLVKTTSGGAIGTERFCIDHAINSLFYASHVIFPHRNVKLLAAKSCSRPLNSQNSGKITEVLPGFLVGSGYGGKGVTDAAGLSLKVTTRLNKGFVNQILFNSFLARYYTEDEIHFKNLFAYPM